MRTGNWNLRAAALALGLATAWASTAVAQHTNDICAGNGEPEKVIEACTYELKADFLYANAAIAYNNRAIAYMRLGKNDLAIKDLTLALKAAPDWTLPLINRAAAYRANGQNDLADADLIALTKRGAFRAEEHLAKGQAYNDLGRYPEALAEFSIGIKQKTTFKPTMISLYRGRAAIYRRTGQDDLAAQDKASAQALEAELR
jgi:tetratricopeptide (TPR) repeat protein